MANIIKAFARNLRTRRRDMGLTQEQLAEVCGLSTNYIARLEVGTSTPSFAGLVKLSKALRVKASDLLLTEYESAGTSEISTTVSALLDPLNEGELDYVLSQLQNSVHFLLSRRKRE